MTGSNGVEDEADERRGEDPARQFTRCTRCNTRLETADETVVRDRLPEGVRAREQIILRCPDCDQLYWRGSHVDRVLAELVR